MTSSIRLGAFAALTISLATVAVPAVAAGGDHGPAVASTWETAVDGGQRTDEVALFGATSPTANNGVESIFVTGVARKSPALEAAGVRDYDVLTTAFDAATGEVVWNVRRDDDVGSNDRPVGIEVNYDNNLVHVVTDADGDAVTVTYAARNGDESNVFRTPGMTVNDTAISVAGSWLFQAGRTGGNFHVLGYENGPRTVSIDDRAVAGEVFGIDAHNDYDNGNTTTWRTAVATGKENVFGSGGDAYTAAYHIDTKTKIWERRWASPDNRLDTGVAVDMSYIRSLGHGVAFVTGKTFHPDTGFDIWVTALDARTGDAMWTGPDGMRFFSGPALDDDEPVDIVYSDASGVVYVTGTSVRAYPYARDVVTLAFDARTGEQLAVAYANGDISNGPDKPSDIDVSSDGTRVFVAAEVMNLNSTGGYRAGVFAYDADLVPLGTGFLGAGGSGVDQAAVVGVSLDGERLLLGGGNDPTDTRMDHTAAAFPTAMFVGPPEPEVPEFPPVVAMLALVGVASAAAMVRRRGRRVNDA